jgi:hypothetical protein
LELIEEDNKLQGAGGVEVCSSVENRSDPVTLEESKPPSVISPSPVPLGLNARPNISEIRIKNKKIKP